MTESELKDMIEVLIEKQVKKRSKEIIQGVMEELNSAVMLWTMMDKQSQNKGKAIVKDRRNDDGNKSNIEDGSNG